MEAVVEFRARCRLCVFYMKVYMKRDTFADLFKNIP